MKADYTILLIACLTFPVIAQDMTLKEQEDLFQIVDIFKLGNESPCDPKINLYVFSLHGDEKSIGLTKEAIVTTVRSRLRGARIYSTDEKLYELNIDVDVLKNSYNIRVTFSQRLFKPKPFSPEEPTSIYGPATTWTSGRLGQHGGDSGYILQSVSELTDEFIDEYLRVNGEFCKNDSENAGALQ